MEATNTMEMIEEGKMPSKNHSYICTQTLKALFGLENFTPFVELTLDIDNGITPDISVYESGKINPDLYRDELKVKELPRLAIEILSPTQGAHEIFKKVEKMQSNGIHSVWVIDPPAKTIIVFEGEKKEALQGEVESHDIKVDFKKIFG